ncbi:MAG: glycosyltransferase family 1 protein [Patescibacteria group bacterium]
MKIGIDLRSTDLSSYGGVSNYAHNLIVNLLKIDQTNQYVFFGNQFSKAEKKIEKYLPTGQAGKFNNSEIKFYSVPNKLFNFSQKFFHYPKIDKLIGGVDVFFSPNILFTSLSKNCKHIICAHDLSFKLFPEFLSAKRRLWHFFVNPKKLYQSADKIIAVSKNTKQDLIKYFNIPEEKIKVIYSGLNKLEIENIKIEETKKKYSLPEKFIFTLSVIEPRKNITSIIEAFENIQKKYPDLNLIIAGRKGWKYKNILTKINNNNKIIYLENISEKEKATLLQLARAFVFPSFYEGFGFPPLEAMSYNTPVITSNNSSLSEICANNAILIDPYNIIELQKAMEEVLSNTELRNNLIERGKKLSDDFTWERTAEETLNLLENIY